LGKLEYFVLNRPPMWYNFFMRDNSWLSERLNEIWSTRFADIPKSNDIAIIFGSNAATRLGSIKKNRLEDSLTKITITGFFKDERVPEIIIDLTIAHEICHYAHGFSSPLPRLFNNPHQGGVVDKELKIRGFSAELIFQKRWLKENWLQITGRRTRRRKRSRPRTLRGILRFFTG